MLIHCIWEYAVPDIRSILHNLKIHVPVFYVFSFQLKVFQVRIT